MSTLLCERIDITEDDYHADQLPAWAGTGPSLSNSIAKIILDKSPAHAHARHPKLGGAPEEPRSLQTFDRGKLAHKLLLGKGAEIVVVDADAWTTKAAREVRDEARAAGKIPALRGAYDTAVQAADIVRAKLAKRGLILSGESEVQVVWHEQRIEQPVLCRGMMDHVIIDEREDRATIIDLKTTRSAAPVACSNSIVSYGYDTQRAAYTRALERLHPELAGRIDFVFIFAETAAPFAVTHGQLNDVLRQRGEERWPNAVDAWADCLRWNQWPEYVDSAVEFVEPSWMGAADIDISFEGEE